MIKDSQELLRIANEESGKYPIWYYKKLNKVDLEQAIWNLLLETFVVEIQGIKYHFTFGKNHKDELIRSIRYDDLHDNPWTSDEITERAFREGTWHSIRQEDTSEEYRADYRKRKEEREMKKLEAFMKRLIEGSDTDSGGA